MIDLHFHSNCSDGEFSPKELSDLIKKSEIEYCSLTDHDNVDAYPEFINYFSNSSIRCFSGVELTALYKEQEIHILSYNYNVNKVREILKKKEKITELKKINELKLAIKLFKQNGFLVRDDLSVKKSQPVGLTIALDVYNNEKNFKKINGQSEEQFYNEYQAFGSSCYTERSGVSVAWIIDNFKDSDLILAHPFNPVSFLVKPLGISDIKEIVSMGLDGIEVYHPDLNDEQIKILENLVRENDWYFTGGSDFHKQGKNKRLGYMDENLKINSFKLYG